MVVFILPDAHRILQAVVGVNPDQLASDCYSEVGGEPGYGRVVILLLDDLPRCDHALLDKIVGAVIIHLAPVHLCLMQGDRSEVLEKLGEEGEHAEET